MNKEEALWILEQVRGRQYHYMKDWGLSLIKMARTYLSYRKLTKQQFELWQEIDDKLNRQY